MWAVMVQTSRGGGSGGMLLRKFEKTYTAFCLFLYWRNRIQSSQKKKFIAAA